MPAQLQARRRLHARRTDRGGTRARVRGGGIVNTFDDPIPGSYIVRFSDSVEDVELVAQELAAGLGGELVAVYPDPPVPRAVFDRWSAETAREAAYDERVDFIDQNAYGRLTDTQALRLSADRNASLDRLDQRENALDLRFRYPHDGDGMRIYIVDSGVSVDQTSFAARVDTQGILANGVPGPTTEDANGHGTAMASVAAGTIVGVAKRASLIPVKVFHGSAAPRAQDVEDGLQQLLREPAGVVNISLAFTTTATGPTVIEQLVEALISAGFVVVASAGNSDRDIQDPNGRTIPARVPNALTVGAVNVSNHARWVDSGSGDGSNYGVLVDMFAPGAAVRVERPGGSVTIEAGTSPAAAFSSGAVAALLQTETLSPANVVARLVSASTQGVLSGLNGSPNRLLFTDVQPSIVSTVSNIGADLRVYCTFGVNPGWRQRLISITASTTDSAGNLYIGYQAAIPGMCFGFDLFPGQADLYVEKRNASGALVWRSWIDGDGVWVSQNIAQLIVSPSGDVYGVGTVADCMSGTCGTLDLLTFRLNPGGSSAWVRQRDSGSMDRGAGMAFNNAGTHVIVVGSTEGYWTDPAPPMYGQNDVFAMRLDVTQGETSLLTANRQVIQSGTSGNDLVYAMARFRPSADTQFVMAGSTTGAFSGQQDLPGADAFLAGVAEINGQLFVGEQLQFGTDGDDEATAIIGETDLVGDPGTAVETLYIAGRTTGSFAGFTNPGGWDVFYARYDSSYSLAPPVWLRQSETAASEIVPGATLSPDDFFIAAGDYWLKVSRPSGLTAWNRTTTSSRRVITADSSRHVFTIGPAASNSAGAFEQNRSF